MFTNTHKFHQIDGKRAECNLESAGTIRERVLLLSYVR